MHVSGVGLLGKTIQNYQLLEALGAGGMGHIYKAEDTRLHRIVAIKVLAPTFANDPERRKRFLQEAQAASALNHPNIVTLFDIVTDGDTQCIVMEFVPGSTLRDVIPQGGLPVFEALHFSIQIASALSAAHAAGIIHRDLKPSNIMVTPTGVVKILDFGLAKWVGQSPMAEETQGDQTLTHEGSIIGTVSYMSPEQAEGKRVDTRTDIFSFGSVMYEMVTGRRAFEGPSGISTLSAILRDEVQPIYELSPEVPPLLEQIILRCLPKDPDARWPSVKEIESALTTISRQLESSGASKSPETMVIAPPPPSMARERSPSPVTRRDLPSRGPASKPPMAPAPAQRKPMPPKVLAGILSLIAFALVLSVGIGVWFWWKNQQSQKPANVAVIAPVQPAPAPPPPTPEAPAAPPAATTPAPAVPEAAPPAATKATTAPKAAKSTSAKKTTATPSATATALAPLPPPPAPTDQPKPAEPAPAPAAPRNAAAPTTPVMVADGLAFKIMLADDVPADAKDGDPVRFTALEDLQVDGKTVVAKGATLDGTVTRDTGKRKFLFMGGSKIGFELLRASTVEERKMSVRSTAARNKAGTSVLPFDSGKGPKNKALAGAAGAEFTAYVDGDQTVSVPK